MRFSIFLRSLSKWFISYFLNYCRFQKKVAASHDLRRARQVRYRSFRQRRSRGPAGVSTRTGLSTIPEPLPPPPLRSSPSPSSWSPPRRVQRNERPVCADRSPARKIRWCDSESADAAPAPLPASANRNRNPPTNTAHCGLPTFRITASWPGTNRGVQALQPAPRPCSSLSRYSASRRSSSFNRLMPAPVEIATSSSVARPVLDQ